MSQEESAPKRPRVEDESNHLMATPDEIAWASGVGDPVDTQGICKHQACKNRKKGGPLPALQGSKYCSKHKCSRAHCIKTSQGSSKLCIGHGGGKRCNGQGCNKAAQGATKFCVLHGGGKRCEIDLCPHSAISGSKYCTRHGDPRPKRYKEQPQPFHPQDPEGLLSHVDDVVSPSLIHPHIVEPSSSCCAQACKNRKKGAFPVVPGSKYCLKHKCERADCPKTSIGASKHCISHGGGSRCKVDGCVKAAQGASKQCILHGGGRRCEISPCISSAISGSKFCTRHGIARQDQMNL